MNRQEAIEAALTVANEEGYPELVAGVDYPDSGDDWYKPHRAYQREAIEEVVTALVDAGWRPPEKEK